MTRNMRPGAWIEMQDVDSQVHTDDASIPPDWPLSRFTELMQAAFAQFGTDAYAASRGGELLHEAGFTNIRHNYIKLPYGTWPKDKSVLDFFFIKHMIMSVETNSILFN